MIPYRETLQQLSNQLSGIRLNFVYGDLRFNIQWFRICAKEGRWKIQKHRHSTFEFHLVASGDCRVITPKGEFTARENEFYITPPNLYHVQESGEKDEYVEYSLNIDIQPLQNDPKNTGSLLYILRNSACANLPDTENLISIFEKALIEASCRKDFYLPQLHCAVINLVTLSARIINENQRIVAPELKRNAGTDDRFEQIDQFISDNISLPLSAEDIADYAHLCSKQISRIIYKNTGLSTHKYVAHMKYTCAKKLLRNSQMTIKEVGQAVGFESPYSFSVFFKSHSGLSPKAYRQKQTNTE